MFKKIAFNKICSKKMCDTRDYTVQYCTVHVTGFARIRGEMSHLSFRMTQSDPYSRHCTIQHIARYDNDDDIRELSLEGFSRRRLLFSLLFTSRFYKILFSAPNFKLGNHCVPFVTIGFEVYFHMTEHRRNRHMRPSESLSQPAELVRRKRGPRSEEKLRERPQWNVLDLHSFMTAFCNVHIVSIADHGQM